MAILQIEPNAANSNATFTFSGAIVTTNLQVPYGNTAQRPASPVTGSLRYNTQDSVLEIYTGTAWASTGATPTASISNVTPGTYNGETRTQFTINGTNFTGDAVVKFVDSSNTEYTAYTVTYVSSSQLLATTPQDFTVAQGPLSVREIQVSGTVTKLNCIDTGGAPSWVTPAGQIGGDIYRNGSVSVTVTATDPDTGATIAYSVLSGALPTGLSLNSSTGVISGTAPNVGSDTTYNFTLRATDNAGNTSDRAFSMIIQQGSPGAPTIGTATRSASQSIQITFTAPANTGGSAITTYTASSNTGGFTGTSASSPITVTGLTNGTAYTFTVTATNSYGTGPASSASNAATPYTVPSAPTIGTAISTGTTTANVPFTAPVSNGGNTITSYTAVSTPGSITGTLTQAGNGTIQVTGLLSGTNYTFIVYATNAGGNSANSSSSNQITTTASGPTSVEYLVVAGGGGGGGWDNGGGGGGGGMLNSTLAVSGSTGYIVTIGGGGAGRGSTRLTQGDQGGNSVFSSVTAIGGGGGGTDTGQGSGGQAEGGPGGSGGGAWYGSNVGGKGIYPGSTYISGTRQGYDGGSCPGGGSVSPYSGGGGGGAGGQGTNGGGTAGAGGIGLQSSILTGSSTYYAGGGGGGSNSTAPAGGSGGGGAGGGRSPSNTNGVIGSTNLGGGGGGNNTNVSQNGANGGSGVVIIAYPSNYNALASIGGGLTYDSANVLSYRSGYRVYKFTAGSGTISW